MSSQKRKKRTTPVLGQVFGLLTVVGEGDAILGKPGRRFKCQCSCGQTVVYFGRGLTSGGISSCGCVRRQKTIARFKSKATHRQSLGNTKTKLYDAWVNMVRRCYDTKCPMYYRYGGRGITVCKRWKEDRSAFFQDMGDPPTKRHSIDRVDNNIGYRCGKAECEECRTNGQRVTNVRWTTADVQTKNKSNNRFLDFKGHRMTIAEWAIKTGIDRRTIEMRIGVLKWPVDKALSDPLRKPTMLTHGGETLSVHEWAKRYGITASSILQRIRKLNWDVSRAIVTPTKK